MFGMNAGWLEQTCYQNTVGGRHWMPPARKKAKVNIKDGLGEVQRWEWSGEQIKQFNIPSFPTSSGRMQKDRDSPC